MKVSDPSGDCFGLPAVVPQNLGKAEAEGAESGVTYAATDRLTLNLN